MGVKILGVCLISGGVQLWRRIKHALRIVLCYTSTYNLIPLVLVEPQRKSQNYLDLSAYNWKLNHSNLCSTDGPMNFEKWELFLTHPVEQQI